MKAKLASTCHGHAWPLYIAVMVTCVFGSTEALAQQRRGARGSGAAEELEAEQVVALSVKQSAEGLVSLFSQLYPANSGGRVVADFRCNNRILARGRPDQLQALKEFLRQADVPPEPGAAQEDRVRVFRLEHMEPDHTLQEVTKMISKESGATFVTDPQRKLLIVQGGEPVFHLVQKLLPQIDTDVREPDSSRAEYKLRIVWLMVEASGSSNAASPPDDLKSVVTDLEKLGFNKPRMVAQALIQVSDHQQFQSLGSLILNGVDHTWRVHGTVNRLQPPTAKGPERNVSLSMSVALSSVTNVPSPTLFDLSTQIRTDIGGDPVVLGMTPTGAVASAFVIQLMR